MKEELEQDLIEIEKLISRVKLTSINKRRAFDLALEFERIFNSPDQIFKQANKYINLPPLDTYFIDACDDLRAFSNSKLKQKDNHRFHSGTRNLVDGLEDLKSRLLDALDKLKVKSEN